MPITIRQLEILHGIIVAGSMGEAAKLLGLSQPTLSQQLAKLEEHLGARLVTRDRSQRPTLTPPGEHWFRTAEKVLDEMQRARQTHGASYGRRQLVLQLGTTPSLRGRFVEMMARTAVELGAFAQFEFTWAANSDEIADLLYTRRINCAILGAASVVKQPGQLDIEPLLRDGIIWAVPQDVPDAVIAEALQSPASARPRSPHSRASSRSPRP